MDTIPAFTGFPQQGIDFLARLAQNNERAWFEAYKAEYQSYVLEPAQAFVRELGMKLQGMSSNIRADQRSNGSGVLMRIHRDTRFSKDKTPYKTNISGMFWAGEKKTESPAFGFQLDATSLGLMAGIFKFSPAALAAYRVAVANDRKGEKLTAALASVRAAGDYELAGEHFKRVPAGYAPDHPRADLLRFEGLYTFSPRIAISNVHSAQLVELCFDHFQKMAPVFHWLRAYAST